MTQDVSVPLQVRGFDGLSAHDFRVKPSPSGAGLRSSIQIRPGEMFYIQDLCLRLIPEEGQEDLLHFTSRGIVPSYEAYSQHVSQRNLESQACLTPSPQRVSRATSLLRTPNKAIGGTSGSSPLVQQAMSIMEDIQEWPQQAAGPAALHARGSSIPDNAGQRLVGELHQGSSEERLGVRNTPNQSPGRPKIEGIELTSRNTGSSQPTSEGKQYNEPQTTPKPTTRESQQSTEIRISGHREPSAPPPSRVSQPRDFVSVLIPEPATRHKVSLDDNPQEVMTVDGKHEPRSKRRKHSHILAKSAEETADESQDSLAGKIITVGTRAASPTGVVRPNDAADQLPANSSHAATPHRGTPSVGNSFHASPSNSTEPASASRSTRSAVHHEISSQSMKKDGTRILFASSAYVSESKAFKKFLTQQGVKVVQDIKDATCLCVGKGELKKTRNLIMAVLLGADIITDDWVTESVKLKRLQDTHSYLVKDPEREAEWGFNLEEAIERGRQSIQVFKDYDIIVTTKAKRETGKSGFLDIKDILLQAGARRVGSSLPKKGSQPESLILIIGAFEDVDTPILRERRCFTKDIVSLSILRGKLDVDSDEFLII